MVLNSFDETNPPRRELLDDCGHCLPTCRTYLFEGKEMDSPRGRIHLMDLAGRGEVPLGATFAPSTSTDASAAWPVSRRARPE
ncbi:hypothetical protein AB0E85_28490 [Streptomyces sp. NPDC029044]|uniref:hypothetical protein n=1 Tax=Streptomyces sp. NPDC029044 TaxID=3157198 RepID=UPI0033F3E65C